MHRAEIDKTAQAAVVDFVRDAEWHDLPKAVRDKASLCLLDDLAAALAGDGVPITAIAADFAAATFPGDQATMLPAGPRASVLGAAFANAVAANAVDIDDCGIWTGGHPGAQVFAVAMALGEHLHLSGERLLTAMVVGYEVAFRSGRCWLDRHAEFAGCGSWGSLACAAIAAHLMGISREQTHHALGIAEYHAPYLPVERDLADPAMVKHGMGWGPVTGLTAVDLAQRGYTGIPSILSLPEYRDWVADIGSTYLLPDGIQWKEYACCAYAHPALIGLRRLVEQHRFTAAEVSRIVVRTYREACLLGSRLPTTTEEAQFNVAWPLAALLVDGEVSPRQTCAERLDDPEMRRVAGLVELLEDEEYSRLYTLSDLNDPAGRDAAEVTVELLDGRRLESGMAEDVLWSQPQFTREKLEQKLRWLVGDRVREPALARLLELLRHVERVPDVTQITDLIGASWRRHDGST